MEHVTQFFLNLVDSFGYPGLFVVMVFGNCGMPVGTELILPAAGALAATGHLSSWWLAAAVATVAELVGGSILYAIGYYGGFYERHGSVVVFVCRFIPFVRGVSGLPAGVSRMQKHQFLLYTALGSAIFCFGLAWLGYVFGRHIDDIMPQLHRYSLGLLAAVVVGAGVWIALRLFGRARPGNAAR